MLKVTVKVLGTWFSFNLFHSFTERGKNLYLKTPLFVDIELHSL